MGTGKGGGEVLGQGQVGQRVLPLLRHSGTRLPPSIRDFKGHRAASLPTCFGEESRQVRESGSITSPVVCWLELVPAHWPHGGRAVSLECDQEG